MALVKKSVGFARGEVILKDDGTFHTAYGWKRRGVWDDVANVWAEPPYEQYDGEKTLQQLKNFVAALT